MLRTLPALLFFSAAALTAQPVLLYSVHFGGGWNTNAKLAVDAHGDAWLALTTERIDLPVSPNAAQGPMAGDRACRNEYSLRCTQVYIAKIDRTGRIVRSTYLGGSRGATVAGIGVDPAGSVWVAGVTGSTDFPKLKPVAGTPAGATSGIFVAKLTADLSGVAGSSLIPILPFINLSMVLDRSGSVYVAGDTLSLSLPLQNAFQSTFNGKADGFLFKLDGTGSRLVYSTYFGGSDYDYPVGLTVDSAGSAIMVGRTLSQDLPVHAALQPESRGSGDGFVVRFTPDGRSLAWSTYLGGSNSDGLAAAAVDDRGDVYVSGFTYSTDFVETGGPPSSAPNGFTTLIRIAAGGRTLVFSRAVSKINSINGLALDGDGHIWSIGTTSGGGRLSSDAFQDQPGSFVDAYVAEWSPGGELLWDSYLGGSLQDTGTAVVFDPNGGILVAGLTESSNFPVSHAALPSQADEAGGLRPDGFIARFGFDLPAPALPEKSIANAAGFAPVSSTAGAAPGTILSIFGEDLASHILPARSMPLPSELADTTVLVNGSPAPLFYVSPTQVNFQLPYGLTGTTAAIQVQRGDLLSAERRIALAVASPGIFAAGGYAAAVWASDGLLADCSRPSAGAGYLMIYATGLGEVTPAVPAGVPAPVPPAASLRNPTVTLAGRQLEVSWAGLVPGYAGLYQINAFVPDDLARPPRPVTAPLMISLGEASSNSAKVCLR